MRYQPSYRPGERIGGNYLVFQVLIGGMGEVFLCLDEKTMQPYALKTFQQRFDAPTLKEEFFKEVSNWVALEKHPNIVCCHHMIPIDNRPFMFLEWVLGDVSRGTSLRDWLRRGRLDEKTALGFIIDILRGLQYAQTKSPGIVHRDLKPENVLVTQEHQAKISDFGLATVAEQSHLIVDGSGDDGVDPHHNISLKGGIVGTPLYMAPEQWQGNTTLDHRTDLYAVGCILYELLTGETIFRVADHQQHEMLRLLEEAHCNAPIPIPTEISWAETFLRNCLAKDAKGRFPTIDDALETLESLYKKQLGEAAPPTLDSLSMTAGEYTNRGLTYHQLQRYDKALAEQNRAIELNPKYASTQSIRI